MIVDTATLPDGTRIQADLCVIGAGPAGITIALECMGAGLDVVLLESGAREESKEARQLAVAESVGHPYYLLHRARRRAFGGSSHCWFDRCGMRARPLDPIDFEARPAIPHSGWPFDRAHLDPYYERAHRICDLGDYTYEVDDWREPPDVDPLDLPADGDVRSIVFRYTHKMIFRDRYDEIAAAPDVRLLLRSTVLEIVTRGAGDRVDHVRVAGPEGGEFEVEARRYVLAAGGIENPRILLLSDRHHPAGLGNQHDLVGRFFMERTTVRSGVLRLAEPAHLEYYQERPVDGRLVQAMLALTEEVQRREGLLSFATYVIAQREIVTSDGAIAADTLHRGIISRPRPPHLGREAWRLARFAAQALVHPRRTLTQLDRSREMFQLKPMVEQCPNPDSRVTLGESRDRFGLRRARLDWRFTDLDHRTIRRAHEILDETLGRGGIGRIERKMSDDDPGGVWHGQRHHMGTTRMHLDPEQGVVDADARVHGVDNLHVAGSSVFPTVGYVNPTLTIVALAIRLADHLKSRLA